MPKTGFRAGFRTDFLRRVAAGLSVIKKDFGVTATGENGWTTVSGGRATRYPGSDLDWAGEAGPLWLNGAVAICLQYIFDKIAEPTLRAVFEAAGGMLQPIPKHPAALLLAWANPEYRGRQLMAALALSYKLNGNAYAVKVRGPGGLGTPRELWYVAHWRMTPLPPPDGGETQFYKFTLPGGGFKLYPRADVIHLRNGLDPENRRLGMAPFRAQLRGVVSDNEIDTYTAVLLRNFGVVGALVSPASPEDELDADQAEELKRRIRESSTGDSRGDIVVPNVGIKVEFTGRSPQDLMLDKIGDRPQARICATFGVDPAAVGLLSNSGGKGEKYGSLRKEARQSSYEQGVLPMLSVFAEGWTQELLPDFAPDTLGQPAGTQPQDVWLEYDYSKVKDLQENADAVHKRAQDDFKSYLTTLDEGRSMIGLMPAQDAEMGGKFLFQLVQAPGIVPEPGAEDDDDDPDKPGKPGKAGDHDDDEVPAEEDEDEGDD